MIMAFAWYYKIRSRPIPYYANYGIIEIIWRPIRKFINVVIIPVIPFNTVRIVLYRWIGFKIGRNVFIGMRCYMDDLEPQRTIIGHNVTISYGCYFSVHGKGQHRTYIVIRDHAYIGLRAVILGGKHGVSIGRGTTIGAVALVTRSIPDGCTAVGIPAKVIGGFKNQNGSIRIDSNGT